MVAADGKAGDIEFLRVFGNLRHPGQSGFLVFFAITQVSAEYNGINRMGENHLPQFLIGEVAPSRVQIGEENDAQDGAVLIIRRGWERNHASLDNARLPQHTKKEDEC